MTINSNGYFPIFLLLIFTSTYLQNPLVLGSGEQNQSFSHSFNRPDPLKHFKPYNGGFDIRNRHYWASAAFTGVHGYATAGAWVLGGLGLGIFLLARGFYVKNMTNSSASTQNSDSYYLFPFLIIIFFTVLAIIVSGIVLGTNVSFNWRARKVKQTLTGVAGEARRKIRKVTGAIKEMEKLLSPYNDSSCFRMNITPEKLEQAGKAISPMIHKKNRSIDAVLNISYVATAGIVSFNLLLVIGGLVFILLHWHPWFVAIIFICWILTATCWFLAGFHFFLLTFSTDMCRALEEYQASPKKSNMMAFIPCVNMAFANHILVETGAGIHNFITQLNSNITRIGVMLRLTQESEDSIMGFRQVCDPFSGAPDYNYDPSRCSKDTIQIGDIPHVLERFTCYENSTELCKGVGKFLSETSFNMAQAYTLSVQSLINAFPDLQSLTRCSFLKETFSTMLQDQCRPLKFSIKFLWSSMLCLSIIMVVLELAWFAKACQDRGMCLSEVSIIDRPTSPL